MRILNVISSLDPRGGGPAEGLRRLGPALAELGHAAEVACLGCHADPFVAGGALPVHSLGSGRGGYGFAAGAARQLRVLAPAFDAVLVRGLWQYHSIAAWRALRGGPVPYFVFPHGMLDPWFNKAYPLKHLKKRLYWPFEYRVLRDAAAVLFTCQEERVLARQSFRPYKVIEEVVSYGTARPAGDAEAQREAFLAAFPKLRDKPFLLFLSRIHPKKGCDVLIKAFAAVHPVRVTLQPGGEAAPMLVIAGPDQVGWNAELVALAERLGVANRIVWPGMLQGDLKWGAFHGCEAFVLPSHQENFGIVVAEAAACGKPVLISNKVNIWREVESDGAGLVSGDNLDGTVDLLRRWAVTSQGERCAMGERARLCFESRFEIHRVAQSLLDVIGKYTGAK